MNVRGGTRLMDFHKETKKKILGYPLIGRNLSGWNDLWEVVPLIKIFLRVLNPFDHRHTHTFTHAHTCSVPDSPEHLPWQVKGADLCTHSRPGLLGVEVLPISQEDTFSAQLRCGSMEPHSKGLEM